MSRFIGALDQGTTSTRFIIFNAEGGIVARAQREHAQLYPQPGWVEHDPLEIIRNTHAVIDTALQAASLTARDIAAVGLTNQRETTVLWRRDGTPLYNALVWQDTRVEPLLGQLAAQGGKDRFRAQTGLPLSTYFSSLKLRWLLEHVAQAQQLAERGELCFGTIDSWLLWNLCGTLHLTDVTNASRTQLMQLDCLDWDPQLLRSFDIPASVLPRIVSSSEVYGEITTGPLCGVPVAGVLGDQQAALVGQGCFAAGEAKNTYGTGCFLLMNTGSVPIQSRAGLLTTVAYRFGSAPACYALEGSVAIAGALVQWLRDNLGIIGSSGEIEALASSVNDNGDVYIVPAFSGLFAPYWQASARGVITGLTRYATKAHLARAALEATAFQTRDVLEAMQRDSGITLRTLRVDGGMVANELLMQFQADLLAAEVLRPKVSETTALGAAYAAGLAVGFWKDLQQIKQQWALDRCWQPSMPAAQREHRYGCWQKAVQRSFDWLS